MLNDCNIDRAGDSEDLQKKCSTVRELDLAQNKLERWEEVFRIMAQMPRLEFVNLSANRLYGPIEAPPCDIQMAQLRSLVLNNTRLEWDSVDTLLNLLPALEELHLSLNDYKNVLIDTHVEDDVTVLAEELLEGTETEGTDEESENHLDNACECHAEKPKSCKRSKTGFGGRGEWNGSYLGVFLQANRRVRSTRSRTAMTECESCILLATPSPTGWRSAAWAECFPVWSPWCSPIVPFGRWMHRHCRRPRPRPPM